MAVTVKRSKEFEILYTLPEGTSLVILIGGRGSGKTYEASKFVAVSATMKRKRSVILRDEKALVRESILNEVLLRYDTANSNDALTPHYERLDTGIKCKKTGQMMVFTKGFRASSNDKKANLKSISDIDIAVIEEAEDITDEDKFNTFADSIRNQGAVIILILNTPDVSHWIIKRFFNATPLPSHDGYFDIEPKQIKGVVTIKTNYKNNGYLPEVVKDRYASYGDLDSHLYNEHHFLTAIMGYASSGRKGQILKHAKPITLAEYMTLPYREYYGQDFGTASPAGLVGIKTHRNRVWCRELNYHPKTALQLGRLYSTLGLNAADLIVCDSAEPKTIAKLRNGWRPTEIDPDDMEKYPRLAVGFNVVPAQKGRDSVTAGLDELVEMELFVTEDSRNLWSEINHYVYVQDKNGEYTNNPVDDHNHCFVAGTLISTGSGERRIEDIVMGDKAATRRAPEGRTVARGWHNGTKLVRTYRITTISGVVITISGTPAHEVAVLVRTERGRFTTAWAGLSMLMPGDCIYTGHAGEIIPDVVETVLVSARFRAPVFDLMVVLDNEYFANGLLVHNCIDPLRYVLAEVRAPKAAPPSSM